MDTYLPRREGSIQEFQHGHYFMYVVEWDETSGDSKRKHREIEVYYAKAKLLWNTTDPSKFEKALEIFDKTPEKFNNIRLEGELPE